MLFVNYALAAAVHFFLFVVRVDIWSIQGLSDDNLKALLNLNVCNAFHFKKSLLI